MLSPSTLSPPGQTPEKQISQDVTNIKIGLNADNNTVKNFTMLHLGGPWQKKNDDRYRYGEKFSHRNGKSLTNAVNLQTFKHI
jgi:hypothetical protein